MRLLPSKNGLDSFFKEVRVFKVRLEVALKDARVSWISPILEHCLHMLFPFYCAVCVDVDNFQMQSALKVMFAKPWGGSSGRGHEGDSKKQNETKLMTLVLRSLPPNRQKISPANYPFDFFEIWCCNVYRYVLFDLQGCRKRTSP